MGLTLSPFAGQVLAAGYLTLLGLLACYGLYRYHLLVLYYRTKRRSPAPPPPPTSWPTVTLQIPVYNERYVVERAIRSACEVDYPHGRLAIQILDDSTDDTTDIIADVVERFRRDGLTIVHLRRADRRDFKAGALAEGLRQTRSDLVALFDVDFIVPRDFLTRAVPSFTDPRVGMVQVRWGHLNEDYSMLTRAQALLINGHFVIEQAARHRGGRFFNFNGTAGIWRRQAMLDAGGWQADTLAEDLDLSFRAQLAGWRGVFLPDLVAYAELPVEMNAFKNQQYRWTKGTVQTAKKLLPKILRSALPLRLKVETLLHLTIYVSYLLGLLASVAFPLVLMGAVRIPHAWYMDAVWGALLALPGFCFYACTQRESGPGWLRRLAVLPLAVILGIGLSVHNAVAVVDGLVGKDLTFVRTTKFGIRSRHDRWTQKTYWARLTPTTWAELALVGYFGVGCLIALKHHLLLAAPSLALFCAGFAYMSGLSLWHGGWLPVLRWLEPAESRTL